MSKGKKKKPISQREQDRRRAQSHKQWEKDNPELAQAMKDFRYPKVERYPRIEMSRLF